MIVPRSRLCLSLCDCVYLILIIHSRSLVWSGLVFWLTSRSYVVQNLCSSSYLRCVLSLERRQEHDRIIQEDIAMKFFGAKVRLLIKSSEVHPLLSGWEPNATRDNPEDGQCLLSARFVGIRRRQKDWEIIMRRDLSSAETNSQQPPKMATIFALESHVTKSSKSQW